jgi:predicted AlkP superfamily pyrophosphatase or phosphodiesterase
MIEHVILLSIPGLRPEDVHDERLTPTLHRLATAGATAPLVPCFPCVTSPVQASMLTGVGPREHGIIGNGLFYPERDRVEFWTGGAELIEKPTFFTLLAQQRPELTSAAWCAQNIKRADATWIITPAPVHEPDGTTKPWCYSKPQGFYTELLRPLGGFPLQHYWGPLSDIQSTRWIVEGALWLAERHAPNFQFVYLPHLDYAGQKYGPHTPSAAKALGELDIVLADMVERYRKLPAAESTAWIVAGEYAMTPVTGAVFPNRILREAGLLKVREEKEHEYLDIPASDAFAMVDHQFAHVYVRDGQEDRVAELFARFDEVSDVLVGRERAALGMDHPRSAPVILISRPDQWFAYYWWLEDAAAPPFARTVDIHNKPGYDPVELFFDRQTHSIPIDARLVKGSHGAPVSRPEQQSLLMTTHSELLEDLPDTLRSTDVFTMLCRAFGLRC